MLTALVLLAHVYISIGSIRLQARPGQPNLSTHQKGSVQLITSFGFDSPGGFIIYDKLFGELDWKNSLLVDVSEPSQLLKLRGNECAVVGYLTQVELGAGSEQFMKFIQTYVATVIKKGEEKDSSLIVVMEGIPDARSRHLMQRIYEHIAEAKLFGRHIKVKVNNQFVNKPTISFLHLSENKLCR